MILVNGDLGFGVLTDYIARFPDNYVNAGVAEQNMTALACGMALEGPAPTPIRSPISRRCAASSSCATTSASHRADVTVVAVGGGFSYGPLGMSHFATEDLAVMRAMPGMAVVAPSDPWMAYELTRQLHGRGRAGVFADRQGQRRAAARPRRAGQGPAGPRWHRTG